MLSIIKNIVGGLAKPVSDSYQKRQERKQARETGQAKLAQAKVESKKQITLTDREWEAIQADKSSTSWKDEYLTIVITSPIVVMIIGGVLAAFGEERVLSGIAIAMNSLSGTGIDMWFLMEAVVLAGVGLKIWNRA
jgi:hypothetical protein